MKRYVLLLLSLMTLASCELAPFEPSRNVYHLGIGINYRGTDLLVLEGPINDAIALKRASSFFFSEPFSSTLLLSGQRACAYSLDEENLPPKNSSSNDRPTLGK